MMEDAPILPPHGRPPRLRIVSSRPHTDPAYVAELVQRVKASVPQFQDSRAWARKLKAREEAGEKLTLSQKADWRAALGQTA